MKKIWFLLILLAFAVISLSACGSDNDDNNDNVHHDANDDRGRDRTDITIVSPPPTPPSIPVHRLLNKTISKHFWSADSNEVNSLASNPALWRYEGVAFRAFSTPQPGTVPVHRFLNLETRQHFWSFDPNKSNILISESSATWRHEGIAFHVYNTPQPGATSLHHLVNVDNNDHLYMIDQGERTLLLLNFPGSWKDDPNDPIVGFAPIQ